MPKLEYDTPPLPLMVELRAVAAAALALAGELEKANNLPEDFPRDQMKDLLKGLKALPQGTAEGCREPLEYTRLQLPKTRRAFFQTEEQSRLPRTDAENVPPLTRGMVEIGRAHV